jgi:hypothetical protein
MDAVREAIGLARQADVILVVGSSLVVYLAAEIPVLAVRSGARMIMVNAEPTPLDGIAEVVVRGPARSCPRSSGWQVCDAAGRHRGAIDDELPARTEIPGHPLDDSVRQLDPHPPPERV